MKNANPVSRRALLLSAALLVVAACGQSAADHRPSVPPVPASAAVVHYTYEVLATWPHDPKAFTQGLLFYHGSLLESTGLYGQSSLREVEPKTGRVLKQLAVAAQYFAEGLTVIGDHAYQLTWQGGKGFVYDADTFRPEKEFSYDGEGWGLTTDGHSLILSDGTDHIRFLDPGDFHVVRSIAVTAEGKPVAIFRHEGRLSAVSNLCAHQNGPLGEGRVVEGCITCPWHGFQYRLADGCAPPPFTEKLATYRLRLADGWVELDPRPNPPGTFVEPLPA